MSNFGYSGLPESHTAKRTRRFFPSGLMVAYHLASGNFSYFAGYGSLVGGDTGQHPITLIIWLTDLPKKNKSIIQINLGG